VYEAYVRRCQASSTACLKKNTFSADLSRMGIIGCRPREGGDRVMSYRGIAWKSDAPDRPSHSGQGGQGIFLDITHGKKIEEDIHIGSLPLSNPDHPDRGQDPREIATHSADPVDYQPLPRPDFGQRCAACGKQGVQHREKPADFNRRRGTAALCETCFENLGATPGHSGQVEDPAPEGAA